MDKTLNMTVQKKTLLIGGNGFIGKSLINKLIASGRSVSIVARSNFDDAFSEAVFYKGDFGDDEFIHPLIKSHDEIIHLAYASVPNTSFENPLLDLQQNLTPSVQLFLETAKQNKKLLLVSSGGTVYGEATKLPVSENHPKHPISPYGLTKLTLENYAYLYGITHGLDYRIVRPSNPYGIGQVPFRGQGFVATAVAAAKLKQPINIFGKTGTIRDYIYIDDLASGILSALLYGKQSEIYNIGFGVGLSNLDVVEALNNILKSYQCSLAVEHVAERPFDVKANILDASKLTNETNWSPQTGFTEGLKLVVASVFDH